MPSARLFSIPMCPSPLASGVPAANRRIAEVFLRIAGLLEEIEGHEAGRRIAAYRRAADTLRRMRRDITQIAQEGQAALVAVPSIGEALASEILEIEQTGRLRLLERLECRNAPQSVLEGLPGVGATLAERIVLELQLDNLEDLEAAAYDGRLKKIRGFGDKRVRAVRKELGKLLSRTARGEKAALEDPPPVALLLELDALYRRRAHAGKLHRIAPHRFNPKHRAWLPVMHIEREGWQFTLMFSNTARAHRLDTIYDWVVVDFTRALEHGRNTVVTEHRGPDRGRRVVRGREDDCREHYLSLGPALRRFPVPAFLLSDEPAEETANGNAVPDRIGA